MRRTTSHAPDPSAGARTAFYGSEAQPPANAKEASVMTLVLPLLLGQWPAYHQVKLT
jgi:hypothetical protein